MSLRIIHYKLFIFLLLCCSFSMTPAQSEKQLPIVNIGIVVDGYWDQNEKILNLTKKEILELTHREFDVRFPPEKTIDGQWNADEVRKAINSLLSDSEVDLVIAWGVMASNIFCWRRDLPKPVIAPAIIDAELQGLPMKDGVSGIKNLNYVSFPNSIGADIRAFLDIVSFKKLAVFVNKVTAEAVPILMEKSVNAMKALDLETVFIPVEKTAKEALAKLPPDIDAAYIAPLIHIPSKELDKIIEGLIERKIPSFSFFGRTEVERGVLAGIKPDVFPKLTRRIALNVQRILLGEDPGNIPVSFAAGTQLTINMATARAIGVSPRWDVLIDADLLYEELEKIDRELNLYTAVQEAISVNLDLAAKQKFVMAGQENVKEARSVLKPQIDLSGTGLIIDEDRAEASFGQQAERTVSGSAGLTQLIYSESVWANLAIQKEIQRMREEEEQQLLLDITQQAATAYLNVLRAITFERIQKENLKRTKSNLEFARVREVVGSAGPAEVYRWESEIATNRKIVIEAQAQRRLAEIQLNRLLHRSLEEHFKTAEVDLSDPKLIISDKRLSKYFGDPQSFNLFRNFLVEVGLENSPEISILDALIAAQQRSALSTGRSFWTPTIALSADVSHAFSKEGAGSEVSFDPSSPFPFPQIDDTDWSIALSLTFPLYKGGGKFYASTRVQEELLQLQLEKAATAEKIEQRIRSATHQGMASYSGIRQSRLAAEAADKSLEVVKDAYSRGAVSILDLLDAQNAALVANLAAANAVYDFMIDLIEVQRAVGDFEFYDTPETREEFFQKAEEYFRKAKPSEVNH